MNYIEVEVMKRINYDPSSGNLIWSELSPRRERGKPAGVLRASGYSQVQVCGKRFYSHRVAFFIFYGYWPSGILDHVNGEKNDNSIRNLRDCNKSLNGGNAKKARGRSSSYKGVSKYRDGRWLAQISKDGSYYFLGYHLKEIDAAKAYAAAAEKLYGEFKKHPGIDDGTV